MLQNMTAALSIIRLVFDQTNLTTLRTPNRPIDDQLNQIIQLDATILARRIDPLRFVGVSTTIAILFGAHATLVIEHIFNRNRPQIVNRSKAVVVVRR